MKGGEVEKITKKKKSHTRSHLVASHPMRSFFFLRFSFPLLLSWWRHCVLFFPKIYFVHVASSTSLCAACVWIWFTNTIVMKWEVFIFFFFCTSFRRRFFIQLLNCWRNIYFFHTFYFLLITIATTIWWCQSKCVCVLERKKEKKNPRISLCVKLYSGRAVYMQVEKRKFYL